MYIPKKYRNGRIGELPGFNREEDLGIQNRQKDCGNVQDPGRAAEGLAVREVPPTSIAYENGYEG